MAESAFNNSVRPTVRERETKRETEKYNVCYVPTISVESVCIVF